MNLGTIDGCIDIQCSMSINQGSGTIVASAINLGTITMRNNSSIRDSGTFVNLGTMRCSGADALSLSNTTLYNLGTFAISGDSSMTMDTGYFGSWSIMQIEAGASLSLNEGTLDVGMGKLILDGALNNNGTFTVYSPDD